MGDFGYGRYEAGLEEGKDFRTSYNELLANDKTVIKPGMYPYTCITRNDAQILATRMNYSGCTSSLIFGLQWDLILKYIETKYLEKNPNSDIESKLTSNSTTIGNYFDNKWNLTNENAKYSTDNGSSFDVCPNPYNKQTEKDILLTTGASESFSLMNIYDIAGNVLEWTLEYNANVPCVYRGGSFSGNGSGSPAMYRSTSGIGGSGNRIGFRVGLWK